jgi:16S rRNA processing protein RimM
VVLGRIGAAHGIKGWVRVQSFTDPPEALLDYDSWREAGGKELEIEEESWDGRQLRVRFRGISDRTAAEALNGLELQVERGELPVLPEGQYYRDELVGSRVRNLAGIELGVLDHFVDTPGQPVMVILGRHEGKEREHWVPVTTQHLKRVVRGETRVETRGETRVETRGENWIEVDWPEDL